MPYRPSTAHASLGREFYDAVEPARFPSLTLRYRNQAWAERIGLGQLTDAEWLQHFGAFTPLPGSFPEPLALRYHGHQFRNYNPDLGDGRGFLFAQLQDDTERLLDFGTKGSGRTPWSRGGDGRLTLKGGVREVLATAMLDAQGVNTSQSFSLIETGEALQRGDEPSPTRSAVLVRLSHSHIRIGSFQRFQALEQPDNIARLLEHCIQYYAPVTGEDRAAAFLTQVVQNVATLGAQWMAAGFVHGVLNTDNINITGESFDYGPWRWLPTYDPDFTAAYFDHSGLYAYGRQPETLLWNLVRLAECLLPLSEKARIEAALAGFSPLFHTALDAAVLRRLGLASTGPDADRALASAWWTWLADSQTPFEEAFYRCYAGRAPWPGAQAALAGANPVGQDHPYFHGTPCTMLLEEVEAIWAPIAEHDDWSLFHAKLAQIAIMRTAYRLPLSASRAGDALRN